MRGIFDGNVLVASGCLFAIIGLQQISALLACLTAAATFAYMAAKACLVWKKVLAEKTKVENEKPEKTDRDTGVFDSDS